MGVTETSKAIDEKSAALAVDPATKLGAALSARILDATKVLKGDLVNVAGSSPALARFKAALAGRDAGPITVVTAGSSTTAGQKATTTAKGYVNLLADYAQRAYPLTSGSASPAVRTLADTNTAPPSLPGIHFVNAGWPGAKSSDYLDSTLRTYIGNVNPHMVIHMIGSNDYATGRTPAQYKASMEIVLVDLRAKVARACVHVLVHSYKRGDATAEVGHVAPDTEFRQVLIDLAAASPADTVFVDLSAEYDAVGVPGVDPLALLDADGVHQNDKGHAYMADLLRAKLGIPLVSPPLAATAVPTRGLITRDSFTGTDTATVNGRFTESELGGTSLPWILTVADAVALAGNKLVRGTNAVTGSLLVMAEHTNVRMLWRFTQIPTAASRLVIRRNTSASTYTAYRAVFDNTGHLKLDKLISNVATDLTAYTTQVVSPNDLVGIYANGSKISVTINGMIVLTATDTAIASGTYAGWSFGATTGFGLDDFELEAI